MALFQLQNYNTSLIKANDSLFFSLHNVTCFFVHFAFLTLGANYVTYPRCWISSAVYFSLGSISICCKYITKMFNSKERTVNFMIHLFLCYADDAGESPHGG